MLSAHAKKISSPSDVFGSYKPLRWVALAVPAGGTVFALCLWDYLEPSRRALDILGQALQMGFITALLAAGLSYVFIAFVPGITPVKFMYRPAPFRSGK
jgi:hypothetical protein